MKQVGAGPMFGLEIGLRLRSRLALAMCAEYALHNTSAWENYAASRGDRIDASVRTFQGALLIRGAIWTNGRDAVTLGLGPGLISPSGEETFGGVSYSYDFLRTRMGLATDLELDHAVGAATSLVLRGGAIFATKGVQYADGLDRDVATLGLTLGVRFYP